MILDDLKAWLTSNYEKSVLSKVSKVLSFISEELGEVKEVYETIEAWEDLDNAQGVALDTWGENVLQYRGQAEDDVYRALIRSKVARDRSTGDYNSLLEIMSLLLNIEKSEIIIEEGTLPNYQTVRNIQLPFVALQETGLTSSQLGRIIARIVAAGIGVEEIIFFGTFEFVDTLETDLSLGYSDVSMTQGGTLGALYEPSNDPDLPI
jgi:hypothetical protein